MKFWIDIEDGAGNKYGDGPIDSALSWETNRRLDRAGAFSFAMPAADPRAAMLQKKRIARCYGLLDGAVTEIGSGTIDKIGAAADGIGPVMLEVSGADQLRELSTRSVAFAELVGVDDGGPVMIEYPLSAWLRGSGVVGGLVFPGFPTLPVVFDNWDYDFQGDPAGTTIYGRFAGESVLAALITMSKQLGHHFYLRGEREIVWLNSFGDSGVRAIQDGDGVALGDNSDACLIQSLSEVEDSYDLITRIYPYGAGNGENRLTLEHCTRSAAAGYDLDTVENFLRNSVNEADADIGRIERYLSYKNIAPIANSAIAMENAANALFDAAEVQLTRESDGYKSYRLRVSKLEQILYPGQSIRVVYRRYVDGYQAVDIDADLYILETTTRVDREGLRTSALQVATVDRWPRSDEAEIASQMEGGRLMEAHPQLTATKDRVGPYTRFVSNSQDAEFNFAIGDETTALSYAKLRFKSGPVVSNTSVAVQADGAHSHTVNIGAGGAHTHDTLTIHRVLPASLTSNDKAMYFHQNDEDVKFPSSDSGPSSHVVSSSSETHTHPGETAASSGSHTHNVTYGYFPDSTTPDEISVEIDGTDRTAALGGPWAVGGGAVEVELDISAYLEDQDVLRGTHTISFSCAADQGEIEAEVVMMMSVQAIAVA